MESKYNKIKSFTDIIAWKRGHKLVLIIYKQTKKFPSQEKFGLTNQIRRCAVSITSNIAEAFGRKSYLEKSRFFSIALGSVYELQNQLLIAKDLGYISQKEFERTASLSIVVAKIINGLIKSSKKLDSKF